MKFIGSGFIFGSVLGMWFATANFWTFLAGCGCIFACVVGICVYTYKD
jgi:hypothetical protein